MNNSKDSIGLVRFCGSRTNAISFDLIDSEKKPGFLPFKILNEGALSESSIVNMPFSSNL